MLPVTRKTARSCGLYPEGERGRAAWSSSTDGVQPGASRCVVLCARSCSTETGSVLREVRDMLDLRYDVTDVRVRPNRSPSRPSTAEHLPAGDVVVAGEHVHLAGSYLRSEYPLDSAECAAARTAHAAVQPMRNRSGLADAIAVPPIPVHTT